MEEAHRGRSYARSPAYGAAHRRLLRYLYDFPRPLCHTSQRRGAQRLVSHAHDVMSGNGLRGQRVVR